MGKIKAFFHDLLDRYNGDYEEAKAEFERIIPKTYAVINEIDETIDDNEGRPGWDVDVDEDGPFIVNVSEKS